MNKRIFRNKWVLIFALVFVAAILSPFICDRIISNSAKEKIFSNADELPYKHCGILLGTSKYLGDGRTLNPYYTNRIRAAGELLLKNKIKYLVISGDNSRKTYSEPEDMRADLILMGIDSNRIFLDYAGFRTFDSMVRLREIFSQTDVCIISQPFHNERALFIASLEGITAVAYNAEDVGKAFGFKVMIREKFARVKVFVDYLSFKKPKFLGPKVEIPQA